MNTTILLISEFIGALAVIMILSLSPVIRNKRPLIFLYPKREGTAALTVGVLVLLITAFAQRFQPQIFEGLINFYTYPGLFNSPQKEFSSIGSLTAQILFSAAIILPIIIGLAFRKQPLLSVGLGKAGMKAGLQMGAALVILAIFLQGKIFAIINGLTQGAFITLTIALAAAIGEEVVFRGYIQPRFSSWLGEKWGWLAAALFYTAWWAIPAAGSFTGDGITFLVSLLYRISLGLLLGWLMKKTGSLYAPILYHTAHLWLGFM